MDRLIQSKIKLSDGSSFAIVSDFHFIKGSVNSLEAALDNWLARTEDLSAESFVEYLNSKNTGNAFFTIEQYKETYK